MNKQVIVFVFRRLDSGPVGGYKMVYEYANRLAEDGFEVHIVYPQYFGKDTKDSILYHYERIIKNQLIFLKNKITKYVQKMPFWFNLNSKVIKDYIWKLDDYKFFNNPDVKFVATALATSFEVVRLHLKPRQNDCYFVQGFESWGGQTPELVYDSYKLPLKKITIAPWLEECILKVDNNVKVVENGLDFNYFKLNKKIEDRSAYEIAMLYHNSEVKRSMDGITALKIVKEKIPELHVNIFGACPKPNDLPQWFSYYQSPSKEIHNMIYNTASIFIAPSRLEGMGLTPAESMICGAAVCCTDNPGFAIFAKHNETALISKAMDVEAMAQNILFLIENKEERIRIAKAGNNFIHRFTWETAYSKFKTEIFN